MAAPGGGPPPEQFSGSSLPELLEWLNSSGIDTSSYGKDVSKSVDLLLEEASGRPARRSPAAHASSESRCSVPQER